MKLTFVPHAKDRLRERGITIVEVYRTLDAPDLEYPGNKDRTVAEKVFPGRKLAVKVVYNLGAGDERLIVSVMRGRPTPRR